LTKVARGIQRPLETDIEVEIPYSFLRAYGPNAATTVPANVWTPIILDPDGEPWWIHGDEYWEWISADDPDYDLSSAGIRCLKEGIYAFSAGAVFDAKDGTGDRAIAVTEKRGLHAGEWFLAVTQPMPKIANAGLLVAGENYHAVDDIIELQVASSVPTKTTENPRSEWLTATLLSVT
jgi:hypothetical protein